MADKFAGSKTAMSTSLGWYSIFKNYLCFLTLSIVITILGEFLYQPMLLLVISCQPAWLWMLTVEAAIIVDSFAYLWDTCPPTQLTHKPSFDSMCVIL